MQHDTGVPRASLPRVGPFEGIFPPAGIWEMAPELHLRRAQDGAVPIYPTRVRLLDDGACLLVRFDCVDHDVWATEVRHDAPLWEEEVVEVFLAAGGEVPSRYFEIEVNPLGTLFDAVVLNPEGRRATMRVDLSWDPPGLAARVTREARNGWIAEIALPWVDCFPAGPPPSLRVNFFRVERLRGGPPEFSCWSPTLVDPPDFHRPECFGILDRDVADAATEDS